VFVVYGKKVVSEYRKEHKFQRFDVARILIDTDGLGIEIKTSIFECELPFKKTKLKEEDFIQEFREKRKLEEVKVMIQQKLVTEEITEKMEKDSKIKETNPEEIMLTKFNSQPVIAKSSKLRTFTIHTNKKPSETSTKLTRRTSLFSPRKEKKEEKKTHLDLNTILENPNYLKYFKTFATNEFSVENVIFYEECVLYKSIQDEESRTKHADKMIETFFATDSIYEINTSRTYIEAVKDARKIECTENIFDGILFSIKNTNLSDTHQRFVFSGLYQDMIQTDKTKKYFLFH
jgi:hypothetical protein